MGLDIDSDLFGTKKKKKGPKTSQGKMNKMITGDGRKKPFWAKKNPTMDEIWGVKKKKKNSKKKK